MICRFCGENRKLVEAHVIPRSFHRINPRDRQPSRLVTNVEGRYTQKIRKGVYDASIVCEECERRFAPWDDYADELFLKSWDRFEKITDRGYEIGYSLPAFDYPLLKLFFLSVLWRAAASDHVMFSKIDLGRREAVLKKAIERSDPGSIDFFGVVLQAFDSTNVGILDPHPERFSGVRFCRFYLSHIIAFVKVDGRPFTELFSSMALGPGRPLVLLQKNFMTSPERRVMRRLVIADKDKGPASRNEKA